MPTRRRAFVALATSLGIAALGLPTAAEADTPGCVTKKEYQAAENGWRLKRVHARFDTHGEQHDYFAGDETYPERQTRAYERCSGLADVHIDYTREDGETWRVSYKSSW